MHKVHSARNCRSAPMHTEGLTVPRTARAFDTGMFQAGELDHVRLRLQANKLAGNNEADQAPSNSNSEGLLMLLNPRNFLYQDRVAFTSLHTREM